MMLPKHARGYIVFAGNRIVAAANPGYNIHTETWKETLLAEEYSNVSFAVDETQTVTSTPICHALTIPVTATHPEAAREFAKRFLQTDFAKHGFIERQQIVGESVLD